MDRGAWKAAVNGVAEGRTQLSDFTFTFTFMHWRRRWQPPPVFLPGESQGQGSLVGCRLWGRTESEHDWSDLAVAAVIGSNGQTQILADYIWPKDTKIHKSYISVNFSPKVFPWGRYKDKAHQQSKSACYCIMKGVRLSSKVNIEVQETQLILTGFYY